MSKIIKCTSLSNKPIEYIDQVIGSGTAKQVYFSPDKSYVVAFYIKNQPKEVKERLKDIVGKYRSGVFENQGGEYFKNIFCWPSDIVEHDGKLGVVVPTYGKDFFFEFGSKNGDPLGYKGKEKQGKWFSSPSNRNRLDPRELGTWREHLRLCLILSRAVRRLHAAGLSHSDLSYKNVLIDPKKGSACLIDLDALVVPGKYPPDILGTPDFIAPEVVKTSRMIDKKAKTLPDRNTDRHALAVLIYMYLLYRHPFKGKKVHHTDAAEDEFLSMGEKALFIEDPDDSSNPPDLNRAKPPEKFWFNIEALPYTLTGPYLSPLFLRAFKTDLFKPDRRPTAQDWETALTKTMDLLVPCENNNCSQKFFVFNGKKQTVCPFCQTVHRNNFPILHFYVKRKNQYIPENQRMVVFKDQSLFRWHTHSDITPNEKLSDDQRVRVGYFTKSRGDNWWFVNENLPSLFIVNGYSEGNHKEVPIGDKVRFKNDMQLLMSRSDETGRLFHIQTF